jgi:hypothetical protein
MTSVTVLCHQDPTGRVNNITQILVWRVTPWNMVDRNQGIGEACRLCLQNKQFFHYKNEIVASHLLACRTLNRRSPHSKCILFTRQDIQCTYNVTTVLFQSTLYLLFTSVAQFCLIGFCGKTRYRIYSRNSRHRVIHAFNTIFKKLPV